MMNSSFVIGIAGGSGSGKSTFASKLQKSFPQSVALIGCDNYYLRHDELTFEERKLLNYDAPESLEFDLMVEQVRALKQGHAVDCPVYDFAAHNRTDQLCRIEPKSILIIDGILILWEKRLRELMDLKIYVETDADERILRRIRRDVVERGRDMDNVIAQYLNTVKPMHNAYVEPTKSFADIIVNGGLNETAFDMVHTKIESLLAADK